MKTIKSKKPMVLNRETLRTLTHRELSHVAGGVTGACSYSGCRYTGCGCDTTGGYSKVQGHCPTTFTN